MRTPGCGREYPVRLYRYETLLLIGWPLDRVARYVERCRHGGELIPVSDEGEWVRLIPIVGTRPTSSSVGAREADQHRTGRVRLRHPFGSRLGIKAAHAPQQ